MVDCSWCCGSYSSYYIGIVSQHIHTAYRSQQHEESASALRRMDLVKSKIRRFWKSHVEAGIIICYNKHWNDNHICCPVRRTVRLIPLKSRNSAILT